MRLAPDLRALADGDLDDAAVDELVRRRAFVAALLLVGRARAPHLGASRVGVALDRLLSRANGDELSTLDRAARTSSTLDALGLVGVDFAPALVDDVAGVGALTVLSMVRNGRTREAAAGALTRAEGALATLALLVRVDDTVPQIAVAASDALSRRLSPARAPELVAGIALIDRAAGARTVEARRVRAEARALLLLDDPLCRAALADGLRSADPAVRLACGRFLVGAGGADATLAALSSALDDESQQRFLWAAHEAARPNTAPKIARALLPRLLRASSPGSRQYAVRCAANIGDVDALEALALDVHGGVRAAARQALGRAGGDAQRERARALLRASDSASVRAGLGALAEIGRPDDFPWIAPHLHDARPHVVAEAVRALVGVHASEGLDAFVDVLHDKLASSACVALEAARGLALVPEHLIDAARVRARAARVPLPRGLRVALEVLSDRAVPIGVRRG